MSPKYNLLRLVLAWKLWIFIFSTFFGGQKDRTEEKEKDMNFK